MPANERNETNILLVFFWKIMFKAAPESITTFILPQASIDSFLGKYMTRFLTYLSVWDYFYFRLNSSSVIKPFYGIRMFSLVTEAKIVTIKDCSAMSY